MERKGQMRGSYGVEINDSSDRNGKREAKARDDFGILFSSGECLDSKATNICS